jgi:hypothetical protein
VKAKAKEQVKETTEMTWAFDDEEDHDPISKEKEKILQEMGPLVKSILLDPDQKDACENLVAVCTRMVAENKKEGTSPEMQCPPGTLRKTARELKKLTSQIETVADAEEKRKAYEGVKSLKADFERTLQDRGLPNDWTFPLPTTAKGKVSLDKNKQPNPNWKPGLTEDGAKILAYRPIRVQGARDPETGQKIPAEKVNDFVIRREGSPNPIEIVARSRVGERAVTEYLKLPTRHNISGIENKYRGDHNYFLGNEILGFACTVSSKNKLTWGVALVEGDDGETVVNMTTLRNYHGKKAADAMRRNFYDSIGQEQPFEDRTVKEEDTDSDSDFFVPKTKTKRAKGYPRKNNADKKRAEMEQMSTVEEIVERLIKEAMPKMMEMVVNMNKTAKVEDKE